MEKILNFIIPVIPIINRIIFGIRFRKSMQDKLSETENDREGHRAIILPLSGFSFSGVLALIVLQKTNNLNLHLQIYYLFLSFVSYLCALDIQKYKSRRWHDQVGTALYELASLSLILSIIFSLIFFLPYHISHWVLIIFAITAWTTDHYIHLKFEYDYLIAKEK